VFALMTFAACVSRNVVGVPNTRSTEAWWGYVAPSAANPRELVITTDAGECDAARATHIKGTTIEINPTECRPVSFGAGTSVFWIVPAVYINGFLGAPTWEECEDLRRRQSAGVDRHDRACQIIRLEFRQ